MATSHTVKLRSSDGQVFEVEREVALESVTVRNTVEDMTDVETPGSESTPIPLPRVSAEVLQKVLEYCAYHVAARRETQPDANIKTQDWDEKYVKMKQEMLFEVILAANYMNIKGLLDITTRDLAQQIKGKTPEEIRALFNIQNEFTPEEEEQVRREHGWALD